MNMKKVKFIAALLILITCLACNSGPKVIKSQSALNDIGPNSLPALNELMGGDADKPLAQNHSADHHVVVEEVLNTEKYSYLYVSEQGKKYWMAIPKMEVKTGETYRYSGGLLKRNFFSREYDRVFDSIYLVSKIWKNKAGTSTASEESLTRTKAGVALEVEVGRIKPRKGSISLADLFANKLKYDGQAVKVTGKCMKVNPKIMGRNWVHFQDGSGEGLDLTVTTQTEIPLGSVLTVEGVIALNKDFGSGYRYDILMEGAEIVSK